MNPWPHGCGIKRRETSNWSIIGRDIAWSLPFLTFGRHRRTNHPLIRNGPGWFATGAVLFSKFQGRGGVLISTGNPLVYWICGIVAFCCRSPAPRPGPLHSCKHFPPSFLVQKKKPHNATKLDLMRLRGLVFWWWCGVSTESDRRDTEDTESDSEVGSAVPSVTFRNGLSRKDWPTGKLHPGNIQKDSLCGGG